MTYADRIPAPRPIPTTRDRFTDARACGHTPEQHRHDDGQDADTRSHDRAIRELTDQLAAMTEAATDHRKTAGEALNAKYAALGEVARLRAELGSAQELLAVVDDVTEQLDRARARYATRPEVTPVEPEERRLQHVSVLANCIACGARCPNGKCPNDTPVPPSSVPPRRAQEQPACTCYPGGFSPGTYEGPMRDCPVHGELSAEARP